MSEAAPTQGSVSRAMIALSKILDMPPSFERDFNIVQLVGFLASETRTGDLAGLLMTSDMLRRMAHDGVDSTELIPGFDEFLSQLMVLGANSVERLRAEAESRLSYDKAKAQQQALIDTFRRLKNDLIRRGDMEGEIDPRVDEEYADLPDLSGFNVETTMSEEGRS